MKGTKRAQHMMEAQPVFLFKWELLFYFSKGMSKSRGDVVFPTRTVQSHRANQVCLFRQGHTVAAEDTQTCPWQHKDGKEQKESERKGWDLVEATKGAGLPHSPHFSFAGPKPSPLAASPLAAVMQVHSLAGPFFPLKLFSNHKIPAFSHPQRRILEHSEPQCAGEWDKAGGEATCRGLALRNDSVHISQV